MLIVSSARIKEIRRSRAKQWKGIKDCSQGKLAEILNISENHFQRMESTSKKNERFSFQKDHLELLANYLECDVNDFCIDDRPTKEEFESNLGVSLEMKELVNRFNRAIEPLAIISRNAPKIELPPEIERFNKMVKDCMPYRE